MKKIFISAAIIGVVMSAVPASAQLLRVGPTVPANGFPAWYQDKTGLAFEFCQPLNQAELDGGWCLLLPGDTTLPETFPGRFADEHFYWAGESSIDFTAGGVTSNALLVLALEAAFANGAPVAGDQIVFARVRIRVTDLPFSGTYTVYHPYGTKVFPNMNAGDRLFDTEDVGIGCTGGQFDCALLGSIGPFLLPSATPGGAELAATAGPVPGRSYIADPARSGAVTGSPVGQNFFRIEGPNGFVIQSSNFSLMGRVFTGTVPGKVTIDRASYGSLANTVQPNKLDVFATAFPTMQTRMPAAPAPAVTQPSLAFYPGACVASATGLLGPPAGVAGLQMFSAGSSYYGQTQPAVIPPAVCVGDLTARDINGQVVPLFSQAAVTDQVTITEAIYDPANGGSLSVKAASSDEVIRPALNVLGYGPMAAGGLTVTPLAAPPSKVHVASAKGGLADLLVTTMAGAVGGGGIPLAANDVATAIEDGGQIFVNVLANDTLNGAPIGGGAIVTLVSQAQLGTASVATTGEISYTPRANAFGSDLVAYTVTVDGRTSPAASVTITITPVNDVPIAVADTASGVANASIAINVLANDTDADGAADLVSAEIASAPAAATATVGAGGVITFQAAAAGTYTFTYRAIDGAGARSAAATVTVTVTGNETITISRADFIRSSLRWRVTGTSTVLAGQTITIAYDNGTLRPLGTSLAGFVIGTAVVDATGVWDLDLRLTSPTDARNPDALNTFVIRPNRIRATSPLGGRATAPIALK